MLRPSARHLSRVLVPVAICALVSVGLTAAAGGRMSDHGPSRPASGESHSKPAHPAEKPASATEKPVPGAKPTTKLPAAKPPAVPTDEHAEPVHADEHAESEHAEPTASQDKAAPSAEPADEPLTADAALKLLQEGNRRWVEGKTKDPNTSDERREETSSHGQHPFASILTCADSRVAVERLFDRGVGDVFVVRVAGNVAGGSESGSLEYGIEHLHTPLLVVMGHTSCGAVKAAAADGPAPAGEVGEIVKRIEPAVERARQSGVEEGALITAAVKENVWQSIFDLIRHSTLVREHVSSGKLQIVGAVYDVATGEVLWMGEHPWQSQLIAAFEARHASHAAASSDGHGADH
jgi:carbonic anhydrase